MPLEVLSLLIQTYVYIRSRFMRPHQTSSGVRPLSRPLLCDGFQLRSALLPGMLARYEVNRGVFQGRKRPFIVPLPTSDDKLPKYGLPRNMSNENSDSLHLGQISRNVDPGSSTFLLSFSCLPWLGSPEVIVDMCISHTDAGIIAT